MKRASIIGSTPALAGLDAATAAPRPTTEDVSPTPPAAAEGQVPEAAEPPTPRTKAAPKEEDVEGQRRPRAVYLSDSDIKLLRRVALMRALVDGERHGVSSVLASLIKEARPKLLAEIRKTTTPNGK